MRLLIYEWAVLGIDSIRQAFSGIPGVEVIRYQKKIKDFHADGEVASEVIDIIHQRKIDAVFSYDFIPLFSMICEINGIPYLSWIYDCPQKTTLSKTIRNRTNIVFSFDRIQTERLKKRGCPRCYYLPLCSDPEMRRVTTNENADRGYIAEASFVGNLYNDQKNRIRHASFSAYTQGFLEGLVRSQERIYGYNFLYDAIPERVREEIVEKCSLELNGEMYETDERSFAADAVGIEVSSRERVDILAAVSDVCKVTLFSDIKTVPPELKKEGMICKKPVSYNDEMPRVFHRSRINLNITSKTIEHGVPLRVFDILACGGFCLTNYQTGIAELFTDGRDLVMYGSIEDAVDKVKYYLSHEEERKKIADTGYRTLKEQHTFDHRAQEILQIAGLIRE